MKQRIWRRMTGRGKRPPAPEDGGPPDRADWIILGALLVLVGLMLVGVIWANW